MSLDNSSLDKGKYLQGVQDMGTLHRQIGDLRELGKLTQPVIHGFHSRRSWMVLRALIPQRAWEMGLSCLVSILISTLNLYFLNSDDFRRKQKAEMFYGRAWAEGGAAMQEPDDDTQGSIALFAFRFYEGDFKHIHRWGEQCKVHQFTRDEGFSSLSLHRPPRTGCLLREHWFIALYVSCVQRCVSASVCPVGLHHWACGFYLSSHSWFSPSFPPLLSLPLWGPLPCSLYQHFCFGLVCSFIVCVCLILFLIFHMWVKSRDRCLSLTYFN